MRFQPRDAQADQAERARARKMRKNPTLPEKLLWQRLRQRPGGFKWRRQHPFGGCIVDFYCPSARLVIELDDEDRWGQNEARNQTLDQRFDSEGISVLRLPAQDVIEDPEKYVLAVTEAAQLRR